MPSLLGSSSHWDTLQVYESAPQSGVVEELSRNHLGSEFDIEGSTAPNSLFFP